LNGLPTSIAGIVGTATWGPVNKPVLVSSAADYVTKFGPLVDDIHDAGSAVVAAAQQGAADFRIVRVTDGTDVAASKDLAGGVLTITARYTGSLGNTITVKQSNGSAAGTQKLTVAMPGMLPEVYDNIVADTDGMWAANMAKALNAGTGPLRGPSRLVTALAGAGEVAGFTVGTVNLTGGANGGVPTDAKLVGTDIGGRKGMYALRGTGASVVMLAGVTDPATFTTQAAFGESEGAYMMCTGPAGQYLDIEAAIASKAAAGLDSAWVKLLLGDWVYWTDPVSGVIRLVPPQAFALGRLANLSPENSSLNKKMYSIVGTQRTMDGTPYSSAELSQLAQAGIDVITNPAPGGNYFAARIGHNTSSNPGTNGDNYTRVTNYIAFTLNAGMGRYIGKLQTSSLRAQAKGTLTSFLSVMEDAEMIGNVNGGPAFSVQLDDKNNPIARVGLGYMQADARVTYLGVVEKFLVNLEGSQVTVIRQSTNPNN
jgi:hypothetical protein